MNNLELKNLINKVGLSQSDLARLIYDTDTINQSQRNIVNRYMNGHVKVPAWLPVLIRLYEALNKIKLY
jgi:transcriptional regulator with XRE-family HTH domain